MQNQPQKKLIMWHKVTELKLKGLNKSQISRKLYIHRDTVSRYLSMSEDEFIQSSSYKRVYISKLECYRDKILSYLSFCQDLSSSQIHDRLREDYSNFPHFHSNTIYNFVQRVRIEHNLPKVETITREFNKLDETEYGKYAQVDFGEHTIYNSNKKSRKVYFMAMVLCRSRYKFVYIQTTPFTTKTAIYAHELAFQYMGGIPHEIIYDQDRVFIHNENLGDYLLCTEFRSFVSKHHFISTFCKKSDPQSKGKVENVVKYVKYNFLKGRQFIDIETLNIQALAWLERTANGLTHKGTQLIPSSVFDQERDSLLPYIGIPQRIEELMVEYSVRKDNTINYKSNYYTLPLGTYKGPGSTVYLSINKGKLDIYNKETGKIITSHTISNERGKLIAQAEHRKRSRVTITELETDILNYFNSKEEIKLYLTMIETSKKRYYLDNLRYLHNRMKLYNQNELVQQIILQMNSGIYNCITLTNALDKNASTIIEDVEEKYTNNKLTLSEITPEKRDIQQYNSIL